LATSPRLLSPVGPSLPARVVACSQTGNRGAFPTTLNIRGRGARRGAHSESELLYRRVIASGVGFEICWAPPLLSWIRVTSTTDGARDAPPHRGTRVRAHGKERPMSQREFRLALGGGLCWRGALAVTVTTFHQNIGAQAGTYRGAARSRRNRNVRYTASRISSLVLVHGACGADGLGDGRKVISAARRRGPGMSVRRAEHFLFLWHTFRGWIRSDDRKRARFAVYVDGPLCLLSSVTPLLLFLTATLAFFFFRRLLPVPPPFDARTFIRGRGNDPKKWGGGAWSTSRPVATGSGCNHSSQITRRALPHAIANGKTAPRSSSLYPMAPSP